MGGETVHAFLTSQHGKRSTIRTMDKEDDCRQLDAAYTCLKMNAVLAPEGGNIANTKRILGEEGLTGTCINPDVAAWVHQSAEAMMYVVILQ